VIAHASPPAAEESGTLPSRDQQGRYALVINDKTGKNQVAIPCRFVEVAEELCKRLNEGEHDGEVWT
jgi:hypothetical protein